MPPTAADTSVKVPLVRFRVILIPGIFSTTFSYDPTTSLLRAQQWGKQTYYRPAKGKFIHTLIHNELIDSLIHQ